MPDFEVWDIVRVPFPYTHRPALQHRPALIVAIPSTPSGPALLWVLMITSAANLAWPTDLVISAPQVDPNAATGLPAPSVVRTAKVATIEAAQADRIGTLPLPGRAAVAAILRAHFTPALGTSA